MAAANTLVGVCCHTPASTEPLGWVEPLILLHQLWQCVRVPLLPVAKVVEVPHTGDVIFGGTIICMVGAVAAVKSSM